MEPRHARMDPLGLWTRHLDSVVSHPVVGAADASMDPTQSPVTVLQVTSNTPADQLGVRRWSFALSITIITYAEDISTAITAHGEAADGILEATSLDNGAVRVSSVRSTQEPEDVPVTSATDWPGQLSSYTMYIRRED